MQTNSLQREAKQWDNGILSFDLAEEFNKKNKELTSNFGKDRYSYSVENHSLNALYNYRNEAKHAHGYPYTAWLQLGLLYTVGLYTAQEQGIVRRGVPFARFWRAHYFDWITFGVRGVKYAWLGGLVAGTVLFGSPDLSFKRAISSFNYYFMEKKLDTNST